MDTLIKLKYYAQCLKNTLDNDAPNVLNIGLYMALANELSTFLDGVRQIKNTDLSTAIQEDEFLYELKANLKSMQRDFPKKVKKF